MTIDEFFEKLPRDGWALYAGRSVVWATNLTMCAYRMMFGSCQSTGSAAIWKAVHRAEGYDPALRARLLAHCGLEEK